MKDSFSYFHEEVPQKSNKEQRRFELPLLFFNVFRLFVILRFGGFSSFDLADFYPSIWRFFVLRFGGDERGQDNPSWVDESDA